MDTQSAAKVKHYKRPLQNIIKDNQPMREYLAQVNNICNMLEAAGHKITENEQVLTILNGLSDEYEAFVAVISYQLTLPSIQYVHSTHEERNDHKKPQDSDLSINYATSSKNKGQNINKQSQYY